MSVFRLVYFEGCPNANKVRTLLTQIGVAFDEVMLDNLPENHPLKAYASPTVLRDNRVILGAKTGHNSGACSLDIPSLDEFKARLTRDTQ